MSSFQVKMAKLLLVVLLVAMQFTLGSGRIMLCWWELHSGQHVQDRLTCTHPLGMDVVPDRWRRVHLPPSHPTPPYESGILPSVVHQRDPRGGSKVSTNETRGEEAALVYSIAQCRGDSSSRCKSYITRSFEDAWMVFGFKQDAIYCVASLVHAWLLHERA